ncbi:MAG: PAS domain S-box protein, partial [Candidatus Obscuribacterales bacterium]|nr:PAS domain S-box protein [Candidatus Obscuribacterales bacterium]
RASLQRRGLTVHCVPNVEHARERLKTSGIDAILLDLSLPDSTGINTVNEIRSVAKRIPIVVFTAESDQSLALDAVKHGAQDFIIKGVASDDSLVRCLEYAHERYKIETALWKEQERLKAIIENSQDAFISMDSKWRITDWNYQAERIFGYTKSESLGQSLGLIYPRYLQRRYLRNIEEYFASDSSSITRTSSELLAIHRDGRELHIEFTIFKIRGDSDYTFCAFARDITERKRLSEEMEHVVQERTAKLTQSNEALREFAKVASHDLQEPLRAVQGFANLLAENTKGKLEKDSEEFIEYILDGTQRMQQLIRSVLVHSQINSDSSDQHATNCNLVIEEVMANLKDSIVQTETMLDVDKLPEVAVEYTQLVQLFQNLISNAMKYRGPEAPHIRISAEQSANQWLFSVRDNGLGIDPQYSGKIFDMFARIHGKVKYPGTGMGLAICKRIVTAHGGSIWVESQLGQGSIFMFTLPATTKIRSIRMKEGIDILLVEDNGSPAHLHVKILIKFYIL